MYCTSHNTTDINSPSVLCIIIFLRLCFALLEEVPLTICEGGLHNPPATTSLRNCTQRLLLYLEFTRYPRGNVWKNTYIAEYLINKHRMRILNLQVQTKLTLHHNLFLTGHRAFFLKRQFNPALSQILSPVFLTTWDM